MENAPVAVVDIGSNSVRLVIYEALARAPFPRFNEKSLCGLGRDLDTTGRLPEEAITCAVKAVHRYSEIARAMDARRIDIFATEAVRQAANGEDLTGTIRERTGHDIRLLTGDEEAHFAAMGVLAGFNAPRGTVGDLGGGSLELSRIGDGEVEETTASLPYGALRMQALVSEHGRDAKDIVDERLEALDWPSGDPTFYVVGGSWRALARIHLARTGSPIHVSHGYEMAPDDARKLAKEISKASPKDIASLPGVPSRRVDTLAGAALVFDRVIRRLAPQSVCFSALGLREGWLHSKLPADEQAEDPLISGTRAFGRPRSRVAEIGRGMIAWTAPLFANETAEEHRLRAAACEVSDIGWRDHVDLRAILSFQRLAQAPFVGVNHAERVFIAGAIYARYGGSSDDDEVKDAFALLSPETTRRAMILGAALRLGYRFSGTVPAFLEAAELRLDAEMLSLRVRSMESAPDADAIVSRMRMLAKALGVERTQIVNDD